MGKVVLITGITGFLGSHCGRYLSEKGYIIVGLKRTTSDTSHCGNFPVYWVNIDEENWQYVLQRYPKVDIIIHAAWSGVLSRSRNDLKQQLKNLDLLSDILSLATAVGCKQIIGFGSQAEYGKLDLVVSEDMQVQPDSAYGIVKNLAARLVEYYCESNRIHWYWFRIFSVFGEREGRQWLIPSVICKMLLNEPAIQLSTCEQKYAYLYILDFVKIIDTLLSRPAPPTSGIYNISGNNALSLKSIIEKIRQYSGNDKVKLLFGSIPMREHQSMHIEGAMNKYLANIGDIEYSDFDIALQKTIGYYRNECKTISNESI